MVPLPACKTLLTTLESNFGSAAVYATFEIGSSDEYEQFRVLPNSKPPQPRKQSSVWSVVGGDSLREQAPGACGHRDITWSVHNTLLPRGQRQYRLR